MSDIINTAVATLTEKLDGQSIDGSVKFDIQGEGGVIIDADGVRASDDDADVTLSADVETFQEIMDGDTNPTAAFMTGKLTIDGDMGLAMKLGSILG